MPEDCRENLFMEKRNFLNEKAQTQTIQCYKYILPCGYLLLGLWWDGIVLKLLSENLRVVVYLIYKDPQSIKHIYTE